MPLLRHNPSEADGPCYLVKDDAKSFQEAEDYCVSLGGNLASSLSASIHLQKPALSLSTLFNVQSWWPGLFHH